MKKLSLIILLASLVCLVGLLAACDTGTPAVQDPCAAGHTEVVDAAVPSSCLEAGFTEGKHCSVCNKILAAPQKLSLSAHTAGDWETQIAPTCTAKGLRQKSCTVCHTVLNTEVVAEAGHDFGGWETVTAATCSQKGEQVRKCSSCDETQTRETNTTGHLFIISVINIPETCTSKGYKQSACTHCGVLNTLTERAPTGHSWPQAWEVSVQPTCISTGTKLRTCANCPETQTEELEKLQTHTMSTWTVDVPATCEAQGARHKNCTVCGLVVSEPIAKRGHDYRETALLQPTCTADGIKVEICPYCLAQKSPEPIPATGHTESAWIEDVAATCLTDGAHHKICEVCQVITKTETLTAPGHNTPGWRTLTPATCMQQGEEANICLRCGEGERRVLEMTEHTESAWIEDVPSTCLTQGTRHKECRTCRSILSTEVLAQGTHVTDQWTLTTMPTAQSAGESKLLCLTCGTATQTAATTLVDDGTVRLSKTTTLSLGGYAIIYKTFSASTADAMQSHLNALSATLKGIASGTFIPKTDSTPATDKEILIGLTNRPESQKAYAAIKGNGFTIRAMGDKIVIVGTNDWLTLAALQYFIHHDLGSTATVTMSVDLTAADLVAKPLVGTTGSNFTYVLDNELDNDPFHMYVAGSTGDGRDFPAKLLDKLIAALAEKHALPPSSFAQVIDTDKTYLNGYEVLFGEIDRTECRAFRDLLKMDEYGYCITGKKVVITAHTDAGLEKAFEEFLAFYDSILQTNGGVLPQGYSYIAQLTGTNWITNFPQPDGVTIYNAQNNNDDSIQIIYTGSSATANGYLAYCQKLKNAGYTLVANTQYDNLGDTGNYFRIYKNSKNVLYVAYNDFKYESVYNTVYNAESNKQRGDFIHYSAPDGFNVYYPMLDYQQCIRVVSAPTATAYLPAAKLLTKQNYKKVCNSSITAVRLTNGDVGMSYILQLEDGRFVIVDGGSHHDENYTRETLYATLATLHERVSGAAPSASNPIHIAAWLVTHSHGDHYTNMNSFLALYVPQKVIKMEYLIGNFPEVSTIYPVGSSTTTMGGGRIPKMQGYFTEAGLNKFEYVKVHTGMALYFANLKMEILMTYEDHAPHRITNSNDTNTVTKWTIGSTSVSNGTTVKATTAAASTTWTMLGDSCIYQSRWLCAMWGGERDGELYKNAYMQSDMVQLAHHGNIGCEVALYKTVQPRVVFFPHYATSYNSYTQNGTNTWQRHVDSYVINTLPSVEYIIVSGIAGTSYTDSITIGFDQNGICFPASGNPAWGIKYDKTNGTVTTVDIAYNAQTYGTKAQTSPVIKKNW